MTSAEIWSQSLTEAQSVLADFLGSAQNLELCQRFSQTLISAFQKGSNVFSCGNGGSHCDAMHFAEELTGRYRKERRPLGALALGDAAHVTCVGNDYGFEHVFARQLEALGRPGDVLLGLSTSGNSKNVINAFQVARHKGITTVALLGRNGGEMRDMADLAIVIPAQTSDRIQEMHIKLIHIVIEAVERELFPANYK
jgi:D-sedoheptulose 7-phosphate isomerase